MQYYLLQSSCNAMYLTQPGNGNVSGTPGQHPTLMPIQTGSSQFLSFRGKTGAWGHAYEILFTDSLAADIPAFSRQAGTVLQVWTVNGGTNQLWTLEPGAHGLMLMNVNSGLVLDVPAFSKQAGTTVQQWTANGGSNQGWTLVGKQDAFNWNNSFSMTFEGRAALGSNFRFVGTSFRPGVLLTPWIMGAPGKTLTSAWVGSGPIRVNDAGEFDMTTLVLNSEEGVSTQPGQACCVLEDESGFIAAVAFFDRTLLAG